MNSLKQKLAQKIKKAAERKRELQQNTQKVEKNNPPSKQIRQAHEGEVQSLFSQLNICPTRNKKEDDGSKDQLIEVYDLKQQQNFMDPFIVQTQRQPEKQQDMERDINIMIGQKQSRQKEEQEEKKKQLILGALKNKKRQRPPKPMDKPTPFNELSPPYQQIKIFASYLPIYEERRRRQHYSTVVDLGVKNLPEVVLQCFMQGIIAKNFMKQTNNRTVQLEIDFVRKFAENRLHLYDFNACKFTPLDHRWLCSRLMKLPQGRGQKYILGERPYCVFKQISDFYEVMYSLDEDRYQYLCEGIRLKYKLTWKESAFHNYRPLDQQQIDKIDTSTIYKLKASPMFGAVLQNDQKQFFKSKQKLYPDKVKNTNTKQQKSQTSKSSEMGSKSEISDSDSLEDSSDDDLSLQNQLNDENQQSDDVGQSAFKSSMSSRKISKRKKKTNQSNSSLSERRNQSSEDESESIYDESDENMSQSMFRSMSQKGKDSSQISKNQIKKRKTAVKAIQKRIRQSRDSINSSEQDHDIFDD